MGSKLFYNPLVWLLHSLALDMEGIDTSLKRVKLE